MKEKIRLDEQLKLDSLHFNLSVTFMISCRCFASTFAIFVLARVLGGLAKGNVSLATAIVTDVSTPKTRQKGMAMIGYVYY